MNRLQKTLTHLLTIALIATLTASCSAEAKKNRMARRADEYMKAGDFERAKLEYTNLLRADPNNPEPYEKIGRIWLDEGVPLRAGPFLVRAKELAPARAEVRVRLAELYIALGALNEARQEALEALRLQPGNQEALLMLADVARTPEEIAAAEEQLQRSPQTDTDTYHLATATLALRKNDQAALDAALTKAVAADPKSYRARMALGRLRNAQGNKEAAENEFRIAAELAPPRATAQLFYAEFKAQNGQTDEAIAHLKEVTKKAPDFIPAWTMIARLTAPKNVDEALAVLENIFRRDAQNLDGRTLQADFYMMKGEPKKAVETLKQLDATYPRVPPIKFQYARALFQAGDFAQCAAMLEQAIGLAPGFNEAHLMLAEVNLRLGNVPAVITAMEEFLKKNPNNTRAEIFLADGYRAAGRFDDAVAILRKQVAAAPNNAEPHLLLGVLLRQQNKPVEAREAFEKAAQLAPANMNALDQLIDLDILAGDPATAYRRVTERLEKTPDSAALHLLEGKIAVAQRDWDRAEAALLRVMHLNANIPRAYELLATTYVGANKLEQAVPQIEAFLAKAPENVGALMTLGILQTELKQYEKARDTYEKLLSIRPDIVPAMNNLAYIYSDHLNQLQKAQEWASKAHSAEPENGAITDTFGWILYRQGDYKGAATLLREAAEKLPNEPEVQHHLGMASYMMGDATAARAAFEAALSSPRDFPGKDEAKRRLDLLAGGGASTEGMTAEELEGLLKQQPNDPLTMVKLADAYEKQGAAAKAAGLYEQAIKINPTLAVATLKLAQLYAGPLQKKDRALELAKKARDLAPGDAKSTALVGRLAFDAGNYSWAYSLLQDSARQLGSDPVVLKDLAWAAYSIGKVNEARQTMERVAQNAPGSAEAADAKRFLALTAPQRLEGDPAEGLEDATAALKDDPKYVPALMLRARAEAAKGGKDQAIKTYADVLARFPEFAPAQKQLAALYLEDPNSRMKAFDLASTARKAMPDDPELAAILGQASYFKRDYSRAAQLLQESNRKKPLEPKPLCYLGLSLAELKQSAAATDTLRQAMNKGLPEPLASDAGKVLQQLESK